MAHLREYLRPCDHPGCAKQARYELRTARNELYGYYCGPHARSNEKRVQADEEAAWARARAGEGEK